MVEDGLSQGSILTMMQDSKGLIWIGTADGLNRFNAYEFETFLHSSSDPYSISDNEILCMTEDPTGDIWIGTANGLNKYVIREDRFIHYGSNDSTANAISNNYITALLTDKHGMIWVGTKYGLNCYEPATDDFISYFKMVGSPSVKPQQIVKFIYETSSGDIWVGFEEELCYLNKEERKLIPYLQQLETQQRLSGSTLHDMWEDEHHQLWVATDQGVDIWNPNLKQFQILPGTKSKQIRHLIAGTDSTVWMGTDQGLIIYDRMSERISEVKHQAEQSSSLSNDMIHALLKTNDETIWVGTGTGLNKYNKYLAQFNTIRLNASNPFDQVSNKVWAIMEDRNGWLWLGTEGGLCVMDQNRTKTFDMVSRSSAHEALVSDEISSLFEGKDGIIWMGTFGGGLVRYDPQRNKVQAYLHRSNDSLSISSNTVRSIIQAPQDHILWIGTREGFNIMDTRTGKFSTQYFHKGGKGIKANSVNSLYRDSHQMLWVGTEGGIICHEYEKDVSRLMRHDPDSIHSLSHDFVRCIKETTQGELWVGTSGGLNRLNRTTMDFTSYTVEDGLPNNVVYAIEEGTNGELWLSTNKGLSRFDPDSGTFENFEVHDGLQGNEFNSRASFKGKDNRLYFGGTNGLNVFYPQDISANPHIPRLLFTHLYQVNRDSLQPSRKCIIPASTIELSYKDYLVTFEFASLNYTNPYKTRYAYMLKPFDNSWNKAGNRRTATYTNVPGGTYELMVKAIDPLGNVRQNTTSINVIMHPPYWQMPLFWVMVLVVLGIFIYLLFAIRTKNIMRRNAELETLVQHRTLTLQEQKVTLEESLTKLQQTQAQLLHADKMASLGQLTAGVAHEINNPVNFIYSGINSLRKNLQALMNVFLLYDQMERPEDFEETKDEIEALKEEVDMPEVISDIQKLMIAIKDGAERTTEIVNSLRAFSRSDPTEMQLANIHNGLDSTILIIDKQLGDNIDLRVNYDRDIPEIECHPGQLNQVFLNILINATQAIGSERLGTISITTRNHRDTIDISIHNSGPTIPTEIRSRIFEPFYTTKEVGQGTGLGLSISYAIIEKHQGSIIVRSDEKDGTTFLIELPKRQER